MAYQWRTGTVGVMTENVHFRCTTNDGSEVSFADAVAAVYEGTAEPDVYRVELTATDTAESSATHE